jgi:hypothetical protein
VMKRISSHFHLGDPQVGSHVDHIDTKTQYVEEEALTVEDAEYVSSYHWLAGSSPIILRPSQVGFQSHIVALSLIY